VGSAESKGAVSRSCLGVISPCAPHTGSYGVVVPEGARGEDWDSGDVGEGGGDKIVVGSVADEVGIGVVGEENWVAIFDEVLFLSGEGTRAIRMAATSTNRRLAPCPDRNTCSFTRIVSLALGRILSQGLLMSFEAWGFEYRFVRNKMHCAATSIFNR
jgi:hypothetical protein